jgi:hypothetical protein
VDYLKYAREAKKFLDELDTSLWPLFTQVNPYRFYRIDEQIGRIAESMINRRQVLAKQDAEGKIRDKKLKRVLTKLEEEKIAAIQKDADYIKVANDAYRRYVEGV